MDIQNNPYMIQPDEGIVHVKIYKHLQSIKCVRRYQSTSHLNP